MLKHLDIVVRGRVQAVGFRLHTQAQANRLGLTGKVFNQSDGSVKIEAEGDEEHLNQLVEWCKHGPERAEVEQVNVTEAPLKHYLEFVITNN